MDQKLRNFERIYQTSKDKDVGKKLFHEYRRLNHKNEDYYNLTVDLGYVYATYDLPIPTNKQVEDFSKHFSSCRSWYKHLIEPTTFYFYLHPCIGMNIYGSPNGKVLREVFQRDCWHYADLPTKEYRKKFGYLAYYLLKEGQIESLFLEHNMEKTFDLPKELYFSAIVTSNIHEGNKEELGNVKNAIYKFISALQEARKLVGF